MFSLTGPLALCLLAAPAFAAAAPDSFETALSAAAAVFRASRSVVRFNADPIVTTAATAGCLRDPACRKPLVVAHRTRGFDAPENSVGGARAAVEAGIPLIETDIRFSKDGTWIMLHDSDLDRTTNLRGPVAGRTWAELQAARLENGEPLPRFSDIYAVSRGRAVLVLDLKVDAAQSVADWIAQNGSFDDLIFFASDPSALASCLRARARYPRMMVMARVEAGMGWEEAATAYGGGLPLLVHPNFPSADIAQQLRSRGAKLYSTLTGHDRVPRWRNDIAGLLLRRGAVLIDTDRPVWLKSLINGLRAASSLVAAAGSR